MTDSARIEAARIVACNDIIYTRTSGDPFFFSSGWASPVFIDLKRLISVPDAREALVELALRRIAAFAPADGLDQIAGCELAGVPFAAIIADRLRLPLAIVRKQSKGFGRMAQIEGSFEPGARTLLVDDLTTDGRTKSTFRSALENAEADVVATFVLLNYDVFPTAPDIESLITLADVISIAREDGSMDARTLGEIDAFAADPGGWSRRHGGIARIG